MAKYTDAQLISQIHRKAGELGRAPTVREVNADKNMAAADTIARQLSHGSYAEALKVAGLNTEFMEKAKAKGRPQKYTDKELIAQLRRKAKELSRIPTQKEVDTDKNMASSVTIAKRLGQGAYAKALKAAKLKVKPTHFSDKKLAAQLRRKVKSLGRFPTLPEVDTDKNMASARTYSRRLGQGSFIRALKRANARHEQARA